MRHSPLGAPGAPLTLAGLLAAAALAACGEAPAALTGDVVGDRTPPVLALSPSRASTDTTVAVAIDARDDLGLRRLRVTAVQRLPGGRDTTIVAVDRQFTAVVTTLSEVVTIPVAPGTPPGTQVTVTASAQDGAGNAARDTSIRVGTGNLEPPRVRVTGPAPGSPFVIGRKGTLSLAASARLKVRSVGYVATGAYRDSVVKTFAEPLRDSVAVLDTLEIRSTATPGVMTITPFVVDSLGQRATGAPVAFAVQPITALNTVPVVTAGMPRRIETRDTIRVAATDPTGIRTLGYEVVDSATRAVIDSASRTFDGDMTLAEATFNFRLDGRVRRLPSTVYVRAFAVNMAQRRAYARLGTGVDRVDTALVVAGLTRPLPNGGIVADGLFVPRYDRLYLTNIERNQLEVFSLRDTSFKRAIVVGSRPWGIVPWPRGRGGEMGDTLLVANSGGTNVSYVQLGADGAGAEVYRYPLPNIIAYSVTTERSTTTGNEMQTRKVYDFSDRPQYLAATCASPFGTGECDDVILVYSTTPTGGQSLPFARRGTIRWENLTRCTSHLFFEQAMGTDDRRADTLEVRRFAADNGYRLPSSCDPPAPEEVLVPYLQTMRADDGATASYSVVVRVEQLGFRDTTFVRNSGNFARAILGEGGAVAGSRAIAYDADRGLQSSVLSGGRVWTLDTPVRDLGISPSMQVSDFIANAFSQVRGVAINFDGALSAVRGDSTYILDPQLRLQGLMQTTGGTNAGFDFHPQNAGSGAGTADPMLRLSFSASTEPQIEVFDSYCYQRVGVIPVRDPIIGPIKATRRTNGDVVLVGASARGVVLVKLDQAFTSGCTPR